MLCCLKLIDPRPMSMLNLGNVMKHASKTWLGHKMHIMDKKILQPLVAKSSNCAKLKSIDEQWSPVRASRCSQV